MRRVDVTDQEILDAGERMSAGGTEISGWSLRRAVGDRGKPEHLLAVWETAVNRRKLVADVQPDVSPTPLPSDLEQQRLLGRERAATIIDDLLGEAWRVADERAEARIADERRTVNAAADRAERQLAEANASIGASEERERALSVLVDELEAELARARTDPTRLAERLASAEAAALRTAEQDRLTIADLTSRLHLSEAATATHRQETAAAMATTAAVQAEAERTRIDLGSLRRELDGLRSAGTDLSLQVAAADARGAALLEEVERERTVRAAAETRMAEVLERLTVAIDRAARAEEQLIAAEARTAAAFNLADAADEEVNTLKASVNDYRRRLSARQTDEFTRLDTKVTG